MDENITIRGKRFTYASAPVNFSSNRYTPEPKAMIFVFVDDGTLDVVEESSDFNGQYEGIDVENGNYKFFDMQLRHLQPRFDTPKERGRVLYFLRWIASGTYQLVPDGAPKKQEFLALLDKVSAVNRNNWFSTVEAVRSFVNEQSV